ncbi:MAG: RNA polymerase sigma factor region1.1 domain-containing protein [Deltaproteobacteria bacterium]|nr:RNA polymerase sigma factor region1.1 domain-containing protein [Deltaproteobacteria bacterium]
MELKIGKSHHARKELFARGLRQGYLTVDEIEQALPAGTLTPSERWLLYFSLRAAEVEIRGQPPAEAEPPQHPEQVEHAEAQPPTEQEEEHPEPPGEAHPH